MIVRCAELPTYFAVDLPATLNVKKVTYVRVSIARVAINTDRLTVRDEIPDGRYGFAGIDSSVRSQAAEPQYGRRSSGLRC
jgi:hypothetical protein